MLKSSLCHYSDAHILVKGTITVVEVGATEVAVQAERNNKQAILFTFYCVTKINNTQLDNLKDLDIIMPMYDLIKYIHNY